MEPRGSTTAFSAGAAVAMLGGLIGLGGAEFRLLLLLVLIAVLLLGSVPVVLLPALAVLLAVSAVRMWWDR